MLYGSEVTHFDKKTDNTLESMKYELSRLQKELKIQQEQKNKLHDLLERGIYDVDTFLERGGVVSDRIKNIEQSVITLKKEMAAHSNIRTLDDERPIMRKLLDEYDSLTTAEKNSLYKQIIKKITYSRTKEQKNNTFDLSIEWNFYM